MGVYSSNLDSIWYGYNASKSVKAIADWDSAECYELSFTFGMDDDLYTSAGQMSCVFNGIDRENVHVGYG
jgi:hypothetical protein